MSTARIPSTPPVIEAAVNAVLLTLGANNPVTVDNIYGDITYIQFFGVGVIVMAIFTSTSFGGGIALIKDRENGIHEGYLVTPVKRSSIILGIISSGTVRALSRVLSSSGSTCWSPGSRSRASRTFCLSFS